MTQGPSPQRPTEARGVEGEAQAMGWTPLLEHLPIGLVLVDGAGQAVAANAAAGRILDTAPPSLLSRDQPAFLAQLIGPGGGPLSAQELGDLGNRGPEGTARLGWTRAKGGILWLDVAAEALPHGYLLLRLQEAELARSQDLFSKVFRACPDAITIASMEDGTYVEVNQVMLDLMELPREAVLGRSSLDLNAWVEPEDRQRFLDELTRHGFIRNFETRFRVGSGQCRPFLVSSEIIQAEGRAYSLNFLTDMTERRAMEATLREVLEHAQGASYKRNLVTNVYEYLSPIFTELTGHPVEAFKSMSLAGILELIHPEDGPRIQAAVGAAMQDSESGQHRAVYRFRHRDGHYLWFGDEFRVLHGDDGAPLALVGCVSDITVSKAVEEELRQSQANLEALVESTSDLIWSVDRNYDLTSFNTPLAKHFAASYGTLTRKGLGPVALLPERRAGIWPALYERVFATGPLVQELPLEDGRLLELNLNPIRHGDAVVGASVFGKDITERRRVEQALKDTVTQLQALLRAIPDQIFLNSREGEYLDFHAHDPELLPIQPGSLLHRRVTEVLPEPLGARFLAAFDRALAVNELQVLEYDLVLGGATRRFEARMVACGEDRVVTIARDITQQRHVADSLRAAEMKYRVMAENVGDVLWILNLRTGQFEYISPSVERLRGFTPEEVLAQPLGEALTPESARYVAAQIPIRLAAYRQDDPATAIFTDEVDQPCKDGSIVPTETTTRYLAGADGVPDRVLGVSRNITERKLAEQARHRLQAEVDHLHKLESLGQLAGGMAHDMNNVLGAILSLASAHLVLEPVTSPAYPAFETIRDAALRGGDMVKRLLTFARQNPVEMRELDLNALLLEEARLLERTTLAKVNLAMDLGPGLRSIRGDGNALMNVFMNICVNAVDAMSEGGTITFRTRDVGEDQVEVVIQDTGSGMTADVLAKAMDPFFTTKEVGKGTGLGLSMAFTIVKAHGGQLQLESHPGEGTRVRLRFPATVTKDPGPMTPLEAALLPAQAALNVLLVDDDDLIQKSTRMLVEALGHAVTSAACGEEALAVLEQGFQADVVILDLNMPGLGGKGTLPRLRELCPKVPVLLSTGRVDQEALDLIAAHADVTLMSKPFTFEELQGHLQAIGRRKAT